jgi:hypothetical protein
VGPVGTGEQQMSTYEICFLFNAKDGAEAREISHRIMEGVSGWWPALCYIDSDTKERFELE